MHYRKTNFYRDLNHDYFKYTQLLFNMENLESIPDLATSLIISTGP